MVTAISFQLKEACFLYTSKGPGLKSSKKFQTSLIFFTGDLGGGR